MRNGYRIIDTDSHQMEPPNIWLDYIDVAFQQRAPRIAEGPGDPGEARTPARPPPESAIPRRG